jgi:hypothetical protein
MYEITASGSAALTSRYPFYPQKMALTSPTSGGRLVGIVCSPIKDTELVTVAVLGTKSVTFGHSYKKEM